MTVAALDRRTGRPRRGLPLVLSLALREQRNGFSGFYVFIACVALGVAAITGVGALADALRASFERQGEVLLGGDVRLSRPHKAAEGAERAWLLKQGRVSERATVRGMARRPDGAEQALVDLRGVDAAYPLVGTVKLSGGMPLDDAVRREPGAVVDPILLERLSLKVGDAISIGTIQVPVRAAIETEPDKITERLTAGPRVLVSLETLQRSGLIDPGSLVGWRYALKIDNDAGDPDAGLVKFREAVKTGTARGRLLRPRPARSFAAGVAHARAAAAVSYPRRPHGAAGRRRRHRQCGLHVYRSPPQGDRHLQEPRRHGRTILRRASAAGAVLCGDRRRNRDRAGPADPGRADWRVLVRRSRSRPSSISRLRSLLTAAAYGFMVALLFTLWPLGRAEQVRAGVLFRDEVAPERILPGWRIVALTLATAISLAATCDLFVRGAVAGALLLPGRDRRVRGLPRPGIGADLAARDACRVRASPSLRSPSAIWARPAG